MKHFALAAAISALSTGAAFADAAPFTLDPDHSTVTFTWSHGGFSTTFGVFFDVAGSIEFDQDDPAASSVAVSFPLGGMLVDPDLYGHLQGEQFFGSFGEETVEFTSTAIEVTGENTALITGTLSVNEMSAEVVLDATMNAMGPGPRGGTIAGFDATTTVLRSDFGVGAFAPFVSDEVEVEISIEASPAS